MAKSAIKYVKENNKYFAVYSKNGNEIRYQMMVDEKGHNADTIFINGKERRIKPLKNANAFSVFCDEFDFDKDKLKNGVYTVTIEEIRKSIIEIKGNTLKEIEETVKKMYDEGELEFGEPHINIQCE